LNYIEIVNDAIQYIESNLHRQACLEELASRYYISPMHFYRIFRAVTNQTVKSYILGRKLSEAAITLKNTDQKVVDIALQYGFNSHESFTRNFVKLFDVAPSRYRKESISMPLLDKVDIIERDFKNENKNIIVNYDCREIKELKLLGKEMLFNPWNSCELEELIRKAWEFEAKYIIQGSARRRFFSVNRSHSRDPSLKLSGANAGTAGVLPRCTCPAWQTDRYAGKSLTFTMRLPT